MPCRARKILHIIYSEKMERIKKSNGMSMGAFRLLLVKINDNSEPVAHREYPFGVGVGFVSSGAEEVKRINEDFVPPHT